jgi:hypothetical protein
MSDLGLHANSTGGRIPPCHVPNHVGIYPAELGIGDLVEVRVELLQLVWTEHPRERVVGGLAAPAGFPEQEVSRGECDEGERDTQEDKHANSFMSQSVSRHLSSDGPFIHLQYSDDAVYDMLAEE